MPSVNSVDRRERHTSRKTHLWRSRQNPGALVIGLRNSGQGFSKRLKRTSRKPALACTSLRALCTQNHANPHGTRTAPLARNPVPSKGHGDFPPSPLETTASAPRHHIVYREDLPRAQQEPRSAYRDPPSSFLSS